MEEPSFAVGNFEAAASTATSPPDRTVTSAAASAKFVVLGLSDGSVALFDVFGNRLDEHHTRHSGAVAAVSLGGGPSEDDVVASAGAMGDIRAARLFADAAPSASGSATAGLLAAASVCIQRRSERGVAALAVDPSFGKPRAGDRIAWADRIGRVTIFTAGWFGGSERIVANGDDGFIDMIVWSGFLLAYATHTHVRVFDTRTYRPVCVVEAPKPPMRLAPNSSAGNVSEDGSNAEGSADNGSTLSTTSSSASQGHGDDSGRELSVRRLAKVVKWACKTRLFMTADNEIPLSPHGEPTILLYCTWQSAARVVRIGPHRDSHANEQVPLREIQVEFKLGRESLPTAPLMDAAIGINQDPSHFLGDNTESPMISTVPFGNKTMAVLVGTSYHGLTLHLVSSEGEHLRSMRLSHAGVVDAELLTIPGGDPLVLVLGHLAPTAVPAVANQSLVYARNLTVAERVKWLLGQNRFSDALAAAESAPGGSLRREEVSVEDVGEQFLESVRVQGDYVRLASVLPRTITSTSPAVGLRGREKVMSKRRKRWEDWIAVFRASDKLHLLAAMIPTYAPRLDEEMYNSVLVELAVSDPVVMLDVLKSWPAEVFNVPEVTRAVETQLALHPRTERPETRAQREALREGLLMMYGLSGRHDETLNLLLKEQSAKVFEYISSHHLYEAVRSREAISKLYTIDAQAATDVLVHAPETVLPAEAMIPILDKIDNSRWSFLYLHAVFRLDPERAAKYHNRLLELYVEHGSTGMLFNLLKTSTHYSLDQALKVMGGRKGTKKGALARERVHVLATMGDLNAALDILLDELGDTFAAIEFASDHSDRVLWERLIEHARTHADTLAALLDSPAGGKVDPVRLIPLLNSEMRIPYLRDRLHRILVDAALERSLREDAAAALQFDAEQLLAQLDEAVTLPSAATN